MKNTEHKNIPNIQLVAKVIKVENGVWLVQTKHSQMKVKKAVSCVIEPLVNDEVLIFRQDSDTAYILSILKRISDENSIIMENLSINTKNLNINSLEINTQALKSKSMIENISIISSVMQIKTNLLNNISKKVQNVFSFFKQTDEKHFQATKEHLDIQCNSSRKVVNSTDMTITKNSFLKAKDEVKIDGGIINLA